MILLIIRILTISVLSELLELLIQMKQTRFNEYLLNKELRTQTHTLWMFPSTIMKEMPIDA